MAIWQAKSVNVTAPTTAVTFDTAMTSTSYTVSFRCYNASTMETIPCVVDPANFTTAGFTAAPVADGVLEYQAAEYGAPVGIITPTGRLSRDWTVQRFWAEAIRDIGLDSSQIDSFEQYSLINRSMKTVAGVLSPLLSSQYLTSHTISSSTGAYASGVKTIYSAILSQSGTDAPTATVLVNTLSGTPVWTRSAEGTYIGTLSGEFPATTRVPAMVVPLLSGNESKAAGQRLTVDTVEIKVRDFGDNLVDGFTTLYVDIEIFDTTTSTTLSSTTSISLAGVRLAMGGPEQHLHLESTATDWVIPMSREEFSRFRSSSHQYKDSIAWSLNGDYIYLSQGSSLSSIGTLTLFYVRVPVECASLTEYLDLPDGVPMEMALLKMKGLLSERYRLPKVDRTVEATNLMKSMHQNLGIDTTLEEIKEKVAKVL